MSAEESQQFLEELVKEAPSAALLVFNAVSQAFRLRPQFLRKQPRARQADWARKVLSRPASAEIAEDVLATYFLDNHLDLLTELLDGFGLEHEEGQLKDGNPPCPAKKALEKAVKGFRGGDQAERRELLLRAFAAQSAIDWPALEELL